MNTEMRLALAGKSLLGLSIGDAFGDSFFGETTVVLERIAQRQLSDGPWLFTDDTVMALAVYEELERDGAIDQDLLVQRFHTNLRLDENRGYGATVRRLLREIEEGGDWRTISPSAFDGMGSMGNGAAMRSAPIGAYYHDDLPLVSRLARASAEVTHANEEAVTGAIAVAIAAAIATRIGATGSYPSPGNYLQEVLSVLGPSDTTSRIRKATTIPYSYSIESLRVMLGDGTKMTAQDTVPFALWCVAHHLDSYEEALWKAVSILGDRDTICAIVGGITILSAPEVTVPLSWKKAVEDVHGSVFRKKE